MIYKIPLKGGDEYDILTKWRKVIKRSPKNIRYTKRKYNKRFRREIKKVFE